MAGYRSEGPPPTNDGSPVTSQVLVAENVAIRGGIPLSKLKLPFVAWPLYLSHFLFILYSTLFALV